MTNTTNTDKPTSSADELVARCRDWASTHPDTTGLIPTRTAFRLGSRNTCYELVAKGLLEERIDGFQLTLVSWQPEHAPEHFVDEYGHLKIKLPKENGQLVARRLCDLIAETFLGPRPPGSVVKHRDGNKLNNAADNLYYDEDKSE